MASSTISWGLTRTVSLSPRSLASITWASSSPEARARRTVAVVSRSPIPLPGTVTVIGRRARTWNGSRWIGADLGDPVEFGSAVAQQDEPEGAGVGPVEH